MVRLHQRDVVAAQPNWFAGNRDDKAILGQPVAATDIGRRFAPDQQGAGSIGDQRGIQHVVEVGVHRDDSLQSGHLGPGKAAVDARRRR